MLNHDKKISLLESCLIQDEGNYADSFKAEIVLLIGDFEDGNPRLSFLDKLSTDEEISDWIDRLTSRIVLKYDDDNEQLSDFIHDYMTNG